MAEFAAAASGAGLASLGVQCCRGLANYYSSYKAYNEQIGAMYEEVAVLTSLFERIERLLSQHTAEPAQAASVQEVDKIMKLCRGRLNTLEAYLKRCQDSGTASNSAVRLPKTRSRILYPFREKSLLTLRDNVQNLRGDLQLSLQILQAYVLPQS